MLITAIFLSSGSPATGLSPTVTVHNLTDGTEDVTDQAMSEVADGCYDYDFSAAAAAKEYYAICDGGSSLSAGERYAFGFYGPGGKDTEIDAIKAKTDNLPASPAAVGSAMTLADDAITAAKFDEATAFPLKSADTGATSILRTGADGDTGETLSDQLDTINAKTTNLPASPAATGAQMDLVNVPNSTAISAIQSGLGTAANQATIAAYLDTEIATIIQHLVDIKGAGWTSENLTVLDSFIDAIKAKTDNLPPDIETELDDIAQAIVDLGGQSVGANTVTITVTTGGAVPMADVSVVIKNSAQTLVVGFGTTDTNGVLVVSLDDGSYKVILRKAGCAFTVPESLTVSGNTADTYIGSTVSVPQPTDPSICRVYDYAIMADGTSIPVSIQASATITSLPHDSGDRLFSGVAIRPTYDHATGLFYWDIVQGATVTFSVMDLGISFSKTVPAQATIRMTDLSAS